MTAISNLHSDSNSHLLFVDSKIENYQTLVAGIDNADVILLDSTKDGIEQITQTLVNYQQLDSIQILSHGDSGTIQLGSTNLESDNINSYTSQLASWSTSLTKNGDILLFGCNVATGVAGLNFIDRLSQLTKADIAASNNLTGNSQLGGDWYLEKATGEIEANIAINANARNSFASVLATYNGKEYQLTSQALSWEQAQAEAVSLGGNLVTINNAAEETWLKQTFGQTERFWIGLSDRDLEGNFEWVNGENTTYRNWAAGEPNDYKFGGAFTAGEDYAQMNWGGQRQWNDMPDSYVGTFRGIIEIEDNNPSEPNDDQYRYIRFVANSEVNGNPWTSVAELNVLDGNGNVLNQADWNLVSVDSQETVAEFAPARYAFDGNQNTFWHTEWAAPGNANDPRHDHEIVIDLGSEYELSGFNYLPRQNSPNGRVGNYQFFAADDTRNWGSAIATGTFANNTTEQKVSFTDDSDDSNPGFIGLETNTYQINEVAGTVDVTIVRTEGSDGVVKIDYDTVEATATAGNDYQTRSGTLTFADGETSKTVSIPILNDDVVEGNENFGFTIDNIVGGATLLAPRTALVTIVDDETGLEPIVDFNNFADTTPLTFNGNASQANNSLRLTSSRANQIGSAFLDRPLAIDSNTSFATQFQFQLSGGNSGADGFTFMLQNSNQALNALGYRGGDLGYGSVQSAATSDINQSLAIEFDTYKNAWDINNNHISVLRDGNVNNALTTVAAPFDLNNGGLLNAWVDYDGNTNVLEVSLANTSNKPDTALLSLNIDLASVVGDRGFLGFSAATGGLVNNHDIKSWELTSNSSLLAAPPSSVSLNSETIISGLNQPTAIEWTPNGERFFVAEKGGVIKVSQNGEVLNTPFIDLSAQVNGTRDRGLLDIAVHPDFFNGSPYVYALYTYDPPEVFQNSGLAGEDGNGNRAARLTRITADANNGYRTAVPGSEVVILGKNSTWENFNAFANSTNDFNEPAAGILADGTNLQDFLAADSESHTIGSVEFGPDGALYVSNGDGTSYNRVDPRTVRVQDIDNLSGKIIRIDPITGEGLADNPFYNGDKNANRSKVYQLGLRNPFRMTVDPRNGDVYVGDVGWTQWEEINSAEAGANFGWPYYEGGSGNNLRTGGYRDLAQAQAFYNSDRSVEPSILALNHGADGINAIVLGDIYTGNAFPQQYQGDLFFNDLGRGIVRNVSFDESGNVTSVDTFATGANVVVQIIEAPDGSLYYVDLDDGIVGRWFFS